MFLSKFKSLMFSFTSNMIPWYYRTLYHMDIGKNVVISRRALLDRVNPRGTHIGDCTWVLGRASILTHDYCRGLNKDTYIGSHCVIGVGVTILPGCNIGDSTVIGAGSVVTKSIPSKCIAVGNPARIIRKNICVKDGIIIDYGDKVNNK